MATSNSTFHDFVKGDQDAISRVFLEYKNLLYFVIASYVDNKDDCNDVLSDAFMKAVQHREEIKEPSKLKTFLCTIARNEAINFSKKNRELPNSELVEEIYGVEDRGNAVLDILEPLLSNKETIVIYYKAVFSYTWEEIYEETGIPVSTARLLYKTAKEKLRKELR